MPIKELSQEIQKTKLSFSTQDTANEEKIVTPLLAKYHISSSIFNFSEYQKMIFLLQKAIAKDFHSASQETRDNLLDAAKDHAVKLIAAFGDVEKACSYLSRYEQQSKPSDLVKLLNDACLFSLPQTPWDMKKWQALLAIHHQGHPNDLIMRIFAFADKIEKYLIDNRETFRQTLKDSLISKEELKFSQQYDMQPPTKEEWIAQQVALEPDKEKHEQRKKEWETKYDELILTDPNQVKENYINARLERIKQKIGHRVFSAEKKFLSTKTSISTLLSYTGNVCYADAQKNPKAAEVFFAHGNSENLFNEYLSWVPQDDPHYIPDIRIEGKEIHPSYERYYLKKLSSADPEAANLGKWTSCCQSIGNQNGAAITQHAISDPKSGFYVLFRKESKPSQKTDEVVAQCWAWRNGDNLVYDSVESQIDFRKHNVTLLSDFYTHLGNCLLDHGIQCVLVGVDTNAKTPANLGGLTPLKPIDLPDYTQKRDSYSQRIVADNDLRKILFQRHKEMNPESLLSSSSFVRDQKQSTSDSVTNEKLCTYLQNAIDEQNWSYVLTLIDQETALLKAPLPAGGTVFHQAAANGEFDVFRQLFEKGANIQEKDANNATILHYASKCGHLEMVQFILKKDAEISAKTNNGETILHFACQGMPNNTVEVLKFLIENKNVDLNAKTTNGLTMADYAMRSAVQTNQLDVIKYLVSIDKDITINTKSKDAQGVVSRAIKNNEWNIVSYFFSHGIDVNIKNNIGSTLLEQCEQKAPPEVFRRLQTILAGEKPTFTLGMFRR